MLLQQFLLLLKCQLPFKLLGFVTEFQTPLGNVGSNLSDIVIIHVRHHCGNPVTESHFICHFWINFIIMASMESWMARPCILLVTISARMLSMLIARDDGTTVPDVMLWLQKDLILRGFALKTPQHLHPPPENTGNLAGCNWFARSCSFNYLNCFI